MKLYLVAHFSILVTVCGRTFAEAGLAKGEMHSDFFPLVKEGDTPELSVRDVYDDVLRTSLQLVWNQRLQITIAKHQLYRISGQTGPTPKVVEVLDSLDTILEGAANSLRDKLSMELVTAEDLNEQPIAKSFFDTIAKSWCQVKSILQAEQSSRFRVQVSSLLRWLDDIDLEMAMQYSTVEGLMAKLKLIS